MKNFKYLLFILIFLSCSEKEGFLSEKIEDPKSSIGGSLPSGTMSIDDAVDALNNYSTLYSIQCPNASQEYIYTSYEAWVGNYTNGYFNTSEIYQNAVDQINEYADCQDSFYGDCFVRINEISFDWDLLTCIPCSGYFITFEAKYQTCLLSFKEPKKPVPIIPDDNK